MNAIRLILFLLLASVSAQAADRVVPRTKRMNMLKNATEFSDVANPELLAELPQARYPFEFAPEVVKEPPPPPPKDGGPPPPPPKEITKDEVLAKIAPSIVPTGVMVKDNVSILILAKGTLPDGSTISVKYGGQPYLIKVTDVTSDSYTLRLDEASLVRQFDAGSGRGVKRD